MSPQERKERYSSAAAHVKYALAHLEYLDQEDLGTLGAVEHERLKSDTQLLGRELRRVAAQQTGEAFTDD